MKRRQPIRYSNAGTSEFQERIPGHRPPRRAHLVNGSTELRALSSGSVSLPTTGKGKR